MPSNCPVEVTPFDQSGNIKEPPVINLNYTNQDFASLKTRLVDFINERFGPEGTVLPNTFNDLVESSIAIMLIENWAFMADTLSFKMDQIVNELFIDTVTEVENAFRLSKLVGFVPQPPISSRSFWTASISNSLATDLIIPTPIPINLVSDGEPITIELFPSDSDNNPLLDEDIIVPAGATTIQSVIGLEGLTIDREAFAGTGDVAQSFQLGVSPVIFDSVRVEVDGVLWDQVDFFTDSQPRREYRLEFDSVYNGFIIFGNNRAGLIPSGGSQITVTYRVGGGQRGNIVTGFVETQRQQTVPGLGFSVPVNFRNFTKGEFGFDGDTINDIRRKLPLFLRTQDRAVTGDDYKTLTDQFATPFHGQIGKSTAVLRNHGCAGNIVDLYVLALADLDDLAEAGNELKVALVEELNVKKMITDFICVRDGSVVSVDVQVDVSLDKLFRKFELELREKISQRLTTFFSLNNWDYGKTLKEADLIKQLSDITEIDTFSVTFTTDDPANSGTIVTTKFFEIIRPDQTTLSFMFT